MQLQNRQRKLYKTHKTIVMCATNYKIVLSVDGFDSITIAKEQQKAIDPMLPLANTLHICNPVEASPNAILLII